MAELLAADCARECCGSDRPKRRDGAHCSLLQAVRCSFGARVYGWAAADGSSLLHELGGYALRQAGVVPGLQWAHVYGERALRTSVVAALHMDVRHVFR